MKFETKSNIVGVEYFAVQDIFFAIKKRDNSLIIDESLKNLNITSFEKFNDVVYLYGGDTTFIRHPNKSLEKFETRVTPYNFYYPNKIIKSFDKQHINGVNTSRLAIYQLNPFQKLYELPHRYYSSGYCFANQYIQIQNERKSLKSLSLLTGEYEWEVDLGGRFYDFHGERKEVDIQNVIGVWHNWLLVSLSDHTLIALEVDTGKIVWEQVPWADYPSLRGGLASLVLENDSLFWYSYNAYFEFHLPTQKSILHQEYPHTDKSLHPFYIQRSVFLGNYVYFIASHKSYILNNIVGVFNRKTLEIEWQEEMDILPKKPSDPYTSLIQIQATVDKIYVLDTGGTLHIFEKET